METAASYQSSRRATASSSLPVLQIATGFWASQALYVAAKAGVAGLLAGGPRSIDGLANDTDLHPQALYRVLRALSSLGIFSEDESGSFANTSLSEFLKTDKPGSLRPYILLMGEPECWRSWGELFHSVKTGKPAFDYVVGKPIFSYLSDNSKLAGIFDDAMASRGAAEIQAVLGAYDFSNVKRVVDIGGGKGGLVIAILNALQNVEVVLFDLPHVVERTRGSSKITTHPRLRFEGGDFFAAVPSGADIYLLKKVIHDWDDDNALRILRNCRRAM